MSITNSLDSTLDITKGTSAMSTLKNNVSWFALLEAAGYMALSEVGAAKGVNTTPDVMFGPLPLFGAHHFEAVKSDKGTRFRRMGGILLAFQQPENGDTILMNIRCAGPLSFLWLSIIDTLYQYGTSKIGQIENKFKWLGIVKAAPLENISQCEDGTVGATCSTGVGITNPAVAGEEAKPTTLAQGVEGSNSLYDSVEFKEQKNINSVTKSGSFSTAQPPRWDDKYRYFEEHRTFNIITKFAIFTKMYIESMSIVKDESMDFTEYEVTLAIRKFIKPLPYVFYQYQIGTTENTYPNFNKKDYTASLKAMSTAGGNKMKPFVDKFAVDGSEKESWPQDEQDSYDQTFQSMTSRSQGKFEKGRLAYNKAIEVKTQVTLGPEEQFAVEEQSTQDRLKAAETSDYAINMLWRASWNIIPYIVAGGVSLSNFGADPLVGKLIAITSAYNPPEHSAGTSTPLDTTPSNINQIKLENAQNSNNPALQNPQPITGAAWNAGPKFLLTNPQTGQLVTYEAFIDEASFIASVTGGTSQNLDDEFVVVPKNKQADFDNVVQFGCIVQKLTGSMGIAGTIDFSDPVEMEFSLDVNTNPLTQTESITPKLKIGDDKIPFSIGLTYFIGNGTPPVWTLDSTGHYQINKPRSDEAYVYFYSLAKQGETFNIVMYLIQPAFST